jgi:hypothetical protein
MRYRLRTLLIVLALGPPVVAGCYFALRAADAPIWATAIGAAQLAFWITVLVVLVGRSLRRRRNAAPDENRSPLPDRQAKRAATENGP